MTAFGRLLLTIAVFTLAGSGTLAASPVAEFESGAAPAKVVDAFHAALKRGDRKAALGLLADKAVIYESGEVELGKATYAASHLAADMEFEKSVTEHRIDRKVETDGSLAWVATQGHMAGKFRGKDVDRVSTETMVLRRGPVGWQIVHIHWSSASAH